MDVVRDSGIERRYPGGSPLNVAYGLGRLEIETRLLTRIGPDSDGDAIRRHLADAGVDLVADSIGVERTSSAIATIQSDGSASYRFDIEWALSGAKALEPPTWVHVGSLATFLTPGADSVERLLHSFRGRTTISYDPNIRSSLLPDHADAVHRFERFAKLAHVVKLSDEDASWLYPTLSTDFVIDRILAFGADVVALTRGADGARIATHDHAVDVGSPRIEVSDTIGAGDSFMAALISELLLTAPVSDGLGHLTQVGSSSAIAAAITCQRAGAQPPTRAELDTAVLLGWQTEESRPFPD